VVTCLYRDAACVVTTLHDAPIPWRRVRVRGGRGGSGLRVSDEVVRAIRTESAVALRFWFGVSVGVVWRWRKRFNDGSHNSTPGSKAAHLAASRAGARATREREFTEAECDARAETSKRLGLRPPRRWATAGGWTAAELALLGTDTDAAVAARIGRTELAVRVKRGRAKVPTVRDGRRK